MRRSAIFFDSFLDGFTMAGFLRPLSRPGVPNLLFDESDFAGEEEAHTELEGSESTVMQAILSLQAKQEILQAEIDAQVRSNEMLRREVELLKTSSKAGHGSSRVGVC